MLIGCNNLYELIDLLGMTYDIDGNEIFLADADQYIQEVRDQDKKPG